jgi:hypothetical protein
VSGESGGVDFGIVSSGQLSGSDDNGQLRNGDLYASVWFQFCGWNDDGDVFDDGWSKLQFQCDGQSVDAGAKRNGQ